MKRVLFLTLCLAVVLMVAASAFAAEITQTIPVKGWHCAGCSAKTEAALQKLEGVKSAKADLDKGEVTITYDDTKVTKKAIAEAVAKLGFQCDLGKKAAGKKS